MPLGHREDKIEHLSLYVHVVCTTAKQVISLRGKNENVCEMSKMKNARAKRAKVLFFIVKYANLWGFCCRRRRDCVSSLISFARYAFTVPYFSHGSVVSSALPG